jgi:APA family basic amino acid/polyamine antiporter
VANKNPSSAHPRQRAVDSIEGRAPSGHEPERLRGDIGIAQYFALGFGTIIGSAWVVLLGDWLTIAGPGGALLGFMAGGVVMMIIGRCYAELLGQLPEAGSEFIYAHRVFGRVAGFVVGWFLILYLVGVTIYEAIALPWVLQVLLPSLQGTTVYTAFGASITTDALAISIFVGFVVTTINVLGVRTAVGFHSVLTYGFLATALVVLTLMLTSGHVANAQPFWATANGQPWWLGTGSLFAFCAYGLYGFQAIPHAIEERSHKIELRTISKILVISIGAAAVFYCFVIISASLAAPWMKSLSASLPAAAAARAVPHGQVLSAALLCATAASLLKAWNGIFMMAVRLLVAMARAGAFPRSLARLDRRFNTPISAILVIATLNILGIFLGRGAVVPITDMCAMVLTLTYVMCCGTVLVLRRRARPEAPIATGGTTLIWVGLIGASIMALVAFVSPFWRTTTGIPLEFQLLLAWLGCGVVFFWLSTQRSSRDVTTPVEVSENKGA